MRRESLILSLNGNDREHKMPSATKLDYVEFIEKHIGIEPIPEEQVLDKFHFTLEDLVKDPVKMYKLQAYRYPVLTAEQEQMLTKPLVELRGIIKDEETEYPPDFLEEVQTIYDAIKQVFVETNGRLVFDIAKRFHKQDVEVGDILNAGMEGLSRAVDGFEDRGYKFSTYAVPWIKQKIFMESFQGRRGKEMSSHQFARGKKYNELLEMLRAEKGREPSFEEIVYEWIKQEWFDQGEEGEPSEEYVRRKWVRTGEKINEIQLLFSVVSLNNHNTSSGDNEFTDEMGDIISSSRIDERASEEEVLQRVRIEQLRDYLLTVLDMREYRIICARMGLNAQGERYTLEEIAEHLNMTREKPLTRERVRQIEVEIKERLGLIPTKNKEKKALYDYRAQTIRNILLASDN